MFNNHDIMADDWIFDMPARMEMAGHAGVFSCTVCSGCGVCSAASKQATVLSLPTTVITAAG